MATALELDRVSKRFGSFTALKELTLAIEEGSFLGLVGRNGAGKTTTLHLVTGLLNPSEGKIRVLGHDIEKEPLAIKRQIGVMPEEGSFLDHLTGPEYLRFAGSMYGLESHVIESRVGELFDTLELAPEPGTLICEYSYGMRKKVALSAALLHGPRLVLLDEPFEGIDPVAGTTIRNLLKGLHDKGVTLVMTSHNLEIVEKLCPEIAILDRGILVGHGSLAELRQRLGGKTDLHDLFVELMGGASSGELSWL